MNPFTLPFHRLPASLPIFPLPNAVVMPDCQLALNIFEPRYLNMVFDALGADRMIGMVQPKPAVEGHAADLYRTGTAGRITFFNETNDGRLMLVLTGICRFDIQEEIPTTRGYRRVQSDWSRFHCDYEDCSIAETERNHFIQQLRHYFACKRLEIDGQGLENMAMADLINRIICFLPLEVVERQLLIEAVSVPERVATLTALFQYDTQDMPADATRRH
ncbi:MAG: LON peptidase substrate-binding domain-containing protein [Methylococcaceae bacterium]|nr:LON peptidase substrate-binding domain-containing protein [Methylococcaceae bacterium]